MSVILAKDQRPEPDLCVIHAEAGKRAHQTFYAEAAIPHFWRVKNHSDKPIVHVYELDPVTRGYALTGRHHARLKFAVPFDLDIDLTGIDDI
ncbi:hypothetical protein [Nonomuraea aridisoli]|nr:hypothetical protein [Nonomuraea aridisoli]